MEKEMATRRWIEKYNASDEQTKMMLKDGIVKRSEDTRYADDYVEFVDDMNGGFVVKENYLVKSTEIRDWQLSNYVYNSPLSIIKTVVDNTNINVTSTCGFNTQTGNMILDQFKHDFYKAKTFPEKMYVYTAMREQHPEHTDDLYQDPFIDYRFHQSYNLLGGNRLRALQFREKDISEAVSSEMLFYKVTEECIAAFKQGQCYLLAEVKNTLQDIYCKVGINATAKAKDIERFIPDVVMRQLTTASTGKRELYYEFP